MASSRSKSDAPWWYNEGASVSQLAGAVWQTPRGWALEEFSVRKTGTEPGDFGRCDLRVEVGNLKLVVEAKQIGLRWTNTTSPKKRLDHAFEKALGQVAKYPDGRGAYRRGAIVFVVPWITRKLVDQPDVLAERLRTLVYEIIDTRPNADVAWSFPVAKRRLPSKRKRLRGRYFPGIVLVLERVKAPSR